MALTKFGIIGLGKMGQAIAYRAIQAQFHVVGFDVDKAMCQGAADLGVRIVSNVAEMVDLGITVFWLMVPQGELVDTLIVQLKACVPLESIIIDGGNSKFVDSMRRAEDLKKIGIDFLDIGTSGGVHGRENGFCLMVGGDEHVYKKIENLLTAVATPGGYALVGKSGAGHYVKMIHNGIEYGLLQAYAEGFHILKDGDFKDDHLDLEMIARLWNHGSVVRSWILTLVENIMREDQLFEHVEGIVAATGMGKWTVEEAHKHHIPVTVIEQSLRVRTLSEKTGGDYATKLVALLRNQFGGHAVIKKENNRENF